MSSPEKVPGQQVRSWTVHVRLQFVGGVREMYQIITLISLMFLTWAAAIWASYAEEKRP